MLLQETLQGIDLKEGTIVNAVMESQYSNLHPDTPLINDLK
jgi:hypothetical protein